MDTNWLKYIEVSITVLTFVFAAIIATVIGLRNTKNENRIMVITKNRFIKHDNLRKATQEICTFSNPYFIASDCLREDRIFRLCEAASLLRLNLHAGYHIDFVLIKKCEKILEEAVNIISSKENKTEELLLLNARRHDFMNLMDIYLATEWKRIKREIKKVSDYGEDWDRDFLCALLYNYYENTYAPGDTQRKILKSPLYTVVLHAMSKNSQADKNMIVEIVEKTSYFQHSKHDTAAIQKAIDNLQAFGVVEHTAEKKWTVIAYSYDEFE